MGAHILSNETVFFLFALLILSLSLLVFRLGKMYIFTFIGLLTVLMNIAVLKQFVLFGFLVTGGNVLYGAIFLLTDMLSEHYGKKEAFRAVAIGFAASLLYVISTQFFLLFTPATDDFAHESMQTLFGVVPRILFGSLLAYGIAQTLDVFLFSKIKKMTKGKFLFLRNNFSTLISQFFDTMIFTFVGLTTIWGIEGVITLEYFWEVALVTYAIKVMITLLDTPFLYLSYTLLSKELQKKFVNKRS